MTDQPVRMNSMDDLTARITKALDDLERLARYSGGNGRWEPREHPTHRGLWQVCEGTYDVATVKGSTRVQHVARWDPQAALDLIDAHREILAEHKPIHHRTSWNEEVDICTTCRYDNGMDWILFPCPTVRAVAKAHRIEVTDAA